MPNTRAVGQLPRLALRPKLIPQAFGRAATLVTCADEILGDQSVRSPGVSGLDLIVRAVYFPQQRRPVEDVEGREIVALRVDTPKPLYGSVV